MFEVPPDTRVSQVRSPAVQRSLPVVALALIFATLAFLNWRRLGSLTVDTGRELEVPLRLLQGQRLYLDVRYYWGPLAPVVNAGIFAIFGARLETAMAAGLASAALMAAGLYLLARTELGPWVSAAVAGAFLALGAFSDIEAPLFNFVLPHNFSATYGMVAATWSTFLLVRHARSLRFAPFAASVTLAVLASLTKVEVAFPVLAVHAAFVLVHLQGLERRQVAAYACGAAAIAAVYGGLYAWLGADLWGQNLSLLANERARNYVAVTMGLEDPAAGLIDLAISTVLLGALVAVAWLASHVARRAKPVPILAALGAIAAIALALVHPQFSLRALPLILSAAVAAQVWLISRRTADPDGAPRLVLLVFGLACLPRILLQVGPRVYGYYLLAPALVALAVSVHRWLPPLLGPSPFSRRAADVLVTAAMVGLSIAALRITIPLVNRRVMLVQGPRGALYLPNGPEREVVARLSRLPPGVTVLALPDAAGLTFLSGHDAGRIATVHYNPITVPDDVAERRILEDWERNPAGIVVWSRLAFETRNTFGVDPLGVGYGRKLREWLEENYEPDGDPRAAYVFLRRRP